MPKLICIFLLVIVIVPLAPFSGHAADCAALGRIKRSNTSITTAESVAAGAFTPPAGRRIEKLPAFCRIAGSIHPSGDSDIRFEVWLPVSGWNGKFLGVGNGGFAGSINYFALADNVKRVMRPPQPIPDTKAVLKMAYGPTCIRKKSWILAIVGCT